MLSRVSSQMHSHLIMGVPRSLAVHRGRPGQRLPGDPLPRHGARVSFSRRSDGRAVSLPLLACSQLAIGPCVVLLVHRARYETLAGAWFSASRRADGKLRWKVLSVSSVLSGRRYVESLFSLRAGTDQCQDRGADRLRQLRPGIDHARKGRRGRAIGRPIRGVSGLARHRIRHPAGGRYCNLLFRKILTVRGFQLPKLDVEGSNPFARSSPAPGGTEQASRGTEELVRAAGLTGGTEAHG
jgi:hypothetical protein